MKKLVSIIAALSIVFSGAVSPVFAGEALRLNDECLDSIVAGQVDNDLTIDGEAQRYFKGGSNLNTVDSANAVQSHVTVLSGGASDSENSADVTNSDDGFFFGEEEVDNDLTISDNAQSGKDADNYFAALSNLNTVDSANAVQSNITTGSGEKDSYNSAEVENSDGGNIFGSLTTNNTLTLEGAESAQEKLWALSNLNTVDSANAVQSNIINGAGPAGGAQNNSVNEAEVSNEDGFGAMVTVDTDNELSLTGGTQSNLIALSNLNTVDSANAVQSNISKDSDNNYSRNCAVVENNDGGMMFADRTTNNTLNIEDNAQHDLMALSNLNTVDSANAVQSNITVANGTTNYSTNNAKVVNSDGYSFLATEIENNEVLSLGGNVQGALIALSTINTVDSANAVQSNITVNPDVTGGEVVDNTSKNWVNKVYNRDADPERDAGDNIMDFDDNVQQNLIALSNINTVDSANAVQSNITVNKVGDTAGDISNESSNKAEGTEMIRVGFGPWGHWVEIPTGVENHGGDGDNKMILSESAQRDLRALSNLNTLASANAVQSNITINSVGSNASAGEVNNGSKNEAYVKNTTGVGENKLSLYDHAQAGLAALSNINTVDSANAVQSNITLTYGDGSSGEAIGYCASELEIAVDWKDILINLPCGGDGNVTVVYPDITVTVSGDDNAGNSASNITNSSVNEAEVYCSGGDGSDDDTLKIKEHSQVKLKALSNLNTVNSANAVQSNITVNNINNTPQGPTNNYSRNCAKVTNKRGNGDNELTMDDSAQKNLMALSNLNTVESANAIQSNITMTTEGDTISPRTVNNTSINGAYVINEDKGYIPYKDNSLSLSGAAQKNLTALSNVNAVSSATAVQSSITVNTNTTAGITTNTNVAYVSNIGGGGGF